MENASKYKFITWISGPIIMLIFAGGTTVLWFFATTSVEKMASIDFWGPTFMFLVLPWILVFWFIKRCWSVVTLDETGICRTLFGILFKKKISWNELYEIRLKPILTGGAWLFFSKISMGAMSIQKAHTLKSVIQIAFSKKLVKAIRQFTDKEIINLPDDVLTN